MRGIAADFIEAGQPVVAVKRGVLYALGHYRAGELLEAQKKLRLIGTAMAQSEHIADKFKEPFVDVRPILASGADGGFNAFSVNLNVFAEASKSPEMFENHSSSEV